MHSRNTTRTIVIISVIGSILFAGAIGAFVFWYEGNEKDAARTASDDMAAALEDNKPSKAPEGASDYVRGSRKHFGPIKSAKTVDVRQVDNYGQTSSTGDDRSWWTSTIFMRTERGAALLLVTFDDSFDPKDAKVESIRELSPRKVAKGALTGEEARDAKRGFASRGGKTANSLVLEGTFTQREIDRANSKPAKPAEPAPGPDLEDRERRQREAKRRIKCVQDARGDVEKLSRCSKL